jgi:hypothetical protein
MQLFMFSTQTASTSPSNTMYFASSCRKPIKTLHTLRAVYSSKSGRQIITTDDAITAMVVLIVACSIKEGC